jgi:hypothetical protein
MVTTPFEVWMEGTDVTLWPPSASLNIGGAQKYADSSDASSLPDE